MSVDSVGNVLDVTDDLVLKLVGLEVGDNAKKVLRHIQITHDVNMLCTFRSASHWIVDREFSVMYVFPRDYARARRIQVGLLPAIYTHVAK